MILTEDQMDALGELVNIGVGKGADTLNKMLGCQIRIQVPNIQTLTLKELEEQEKKNADLDSKNVDLQSKNGDLKILGKRAVSGKSRGSVCVKRCASKAYSI